MRQVSRLSLRDLFYVLFRDKHRIAAIVAVSVLSTAAILALREPVYTAESRLVVTLGKEKLAGIEAYNKENYNILFQERGQDVHNAIEMIRDPQFVYAVLDRLRPLLPAPSEPSGAFGRFKRDLRAALSDLSDRMDRILQTAGLTRAISQAERSARQLRDAIGVEAIEDTSVVKVTVSWSDPQAAALAVNAIVDELLAQHARVFSNADSQSLYVDQVRRSEIALHEIDSELLAFRARHGISSLPTQREMLLKEIADHRRATADASLRLEENRNMRSAVRQAFAEPDGWAQTPGSASGSGAELSSLDRQYFELLAKRAQLLSTHGTASPDLSRIGDALAQLRKTKSDALSTYYQIHMRAAQEERDAMSRLVAEKSARLERLNAASVRLVELERARGMAEQQVLNYRRKAEELKVSDHLNDPKYSGLRVVSSARPPAVPAGPRKGLILVLAAAFGVLLGIAYSAVREYFDQTFASADDVERVLGVRSLLVLPRLDLRVGRPV
jgi:uncharacterized protein involved in exopolysaccharide biosynthesis